MRHMSEADKIWFRQEIRGAARQVIYEEFGEVLQVLRAITAKGDMDAVAAMAGSKTEEAEDGEECGDDVGRKAGDQDVPVQGFVTCGDCEHWRQDAFYNVFHTSRYYPRKTTGYGICSRIYDKGPMEVGSFSRLIELPKDSVVLSGSVILFGRDYGCIHGKTK